MTILPSLLGFGIVAVGVACTWLGWVLHREWEWRGAERSRERLRVTATPVHQAQAGRPRAAAVARPVYKITDAAGSRVSTSKGS